MNRILAIATSALLMAGPSLAGQSPDLREFSVGMPASALPESGYTGFTCAADPSVALTGWQDWKRCPADAAGLHEVRFRYDGGDTKVAGHQVLLTLLLGDPGRVDGLRIETDPASRLYMHKKAFLLGMQAKSHYGEDGWTCSEGSPTDRDQPVGGTFLRESCDKTADGRHITVERSLFRHPDQPLKDFVDETRISIMSVQGRS